MVKNNLFMIIAIASLCTSMCYGMNPDTDDCFDFNTAIPIQIYQEFANAKTLIGTISSGTDLIYSNNQHSALKQQNATKYFEKLPIPKLPQPRTPKTGYGLAFLPQNSPIKRNLKLLCKDQQNMQDLKTIARYLEDENHLYNIDRECPKDKEGGIFGGIKRASALALSKKIENDKWQRNFLDAKNRIVNNLPQPQRVQALENLDKAIENAQYNRFQSKYYS